MKMEQTECSETSAFKLQAPGNYPKENIQQAAIYLTASLTFITAMAGTRHWILF